MAKRDPVAAQRALIAQMEKDGDYVSLPKPGDPALCILDGCYSAEQLEAIAVVMRADGGTHDKKK